MLAVRLATCLFSASGGWASTSSVAAVDTSTASEAVWTNTSTRAEWTQTGTSASDGGEWFGDIRRGLDEGLERHREHEKAEELIVRAPRGRMGVGEARIEAPEALAMPGMQGDAVKVVQNLPGVARSGAGSTALVVWGAAPGDTRAYVDGILVPRIFHTSGVRSTIGSELTASVRLVPGGYGAHRGRAIGGLVEVETKEISFDEGVHGHLCADVLDLAGSVRARLSEELTSHTGLRYGWLDKTFGAMVDEASRELVPLPKYWDYQQKLTWVPNQADQLDLLVFGSGDEVERSIASSDPSQIRHEKERISYHRLGLRWRRHADDGSDWEVIPWIGYEDNARDQQFGEVPAGVAGTALRGALRVTRRQLSTKHLTLELGADLELSDERLERSGALSLPAREGDVTVFGLPPGDRVNADRWRITTAGAGIYAAAELSFGKLTLQPGLRIDLTAIDGDRITPPRGDEPQIGHSSFDVRLGPRLQLRYRLPGSASLIAAAGVYGQPPAATDLSSVFGNPRLQPASSTHVLAGATAFVLSAVWVEVTAFATRSSGLATRAPVATPAVARALEDGGVGRSAGVQALLRFSFSESIGGWITYTLMRAERRDHDGEPWRLFDYDQTHVLTGLASWELGSGFQVGTRFRYATGVPRTLVADAYFDAGAGRWEPVFSEHNGARLPAFVQLDLRAAWNWQEAPYAFSAYVEIQNVTNRQNAEELVYRSDFAERAFVTGFPFLPVIGIRGEL